MMRILKGQISIEFMIIFSFILVVFLFLFALITQQRALTQNSQTFSQLQLVAQSLALQISRASQAGAGYSALIPITTNIGNIPYNLSVTKGGAVIVSTKVGTQQITTTAYSNVQSVISSSLFYGATNSIYVLPITNGSIYLQNSFGNICIDYQCPIGTNMTSSVSLSTQVVSVANLNGASSFSLPSAAAITGSTDRSVSFWLRTPTSFKAGQYIFSWGAQSSGQLYGMAFWDTGTQSRLDSPNWGVVDQISATYLQPNRYYFITATLSSSGTLTNLYINGKLDANYPSSTTARNTASSNVIVGHLLGAADLTTNLAPGSSLANFQIYNGVALSANQVYSLYLEGISGPPLQLGTISAWTPLNGNLKDYSGNGNDGSATNSIIFTTTAQIFAKASNAFGQPISGLLVGFESSMGNFSNGASLSLAQSNYTNSNGIAVAFLNQQGASGTALVKATALAGNFLPQSGLVAWYPLNFGQGSVAQDLSVNKNSASFIGSPRPQWALPNYVATFNGQNGYIFANGSTALAGLSTATVSFWVNLKNNNGNQFFMRLGSSSLDSFQVKLVGSAYNNAIRFRTDNSLGGSVLDGPAPMITGQWVLVTETFDGAKDNYYLNGNPVNSLPWSGPFPSTHGYSIMIGGIPGFTPTQSSGVFFNGSMSNLQIYSQNLTTSQIEQLYSQGMTSAPVSNTVLAWYPLDGNANDYSGNNFNGSIYGGVSFTPALAAVPSQQVSSGNLNKILSANFLALNSIPIRSANILNPTNSMSISAWVYPTVSQIKVIAAKNNIPSGAGMDYELLQYNQNIHFDLAKSGSTTILASNTMIPLNSWHYVVGTWDGNTMRIYIDGVVDANSIALTNNIDTSQNALTIGAYYNGGYPFNGLIANVQLYNTTLSAGQVQQSYLLGVSATPPSSQQPIGWWPLNGNANDYSNFGHDGTSANVVYKNMPNYIPFLISSANYSGVSFNGQANYLDAKNSILANFASSSSSFTISAMFKSSFQNSSTNLLGNQNIVAKGACGAPSGYRLRLHNGFLNFFLNSGGSSVGSILYNAKRYNDGAWHQVTAVNDNSLLLLYVDGSLATSSSATAGQSILSAGNLSIGYDLTAGGAGGCGVEYFNGSISNVQIYNSALTVSQIQQLYASSTLTSASTTVPLSWFP